MSAPGGEQIPARVDLAAATHSAAGFSRSYVRYALVLLMFVYIVNFIDRQVVNIVAEPIKRELGLADWQIGLMSGLAFAVFYTLVGLPIARVAERRNRVIIIAASSVVWSGFTAVCGLAQNYWQLVAARVGVGVGEAGCTPAAHSLIADYVPRERRASALAFYALGAPLGGLVGLLVGGLVADALGWRASFLAAGVPGFLLALLLLATLREPRRLVPEARRPNSSTFRETLTVLAAKPTYLLVCGGSALSAFLGLGHSAFLASFFLRNHPEDLATLASSVGLQPLGFLGLALGVLGGVGGVIGSMLGGTLADRFGSKDPSAYMVAPALGALIGVPVYFWAMLTPSVPLAMALLAFSALLNALYFGPVWATIQGVAPVNMRATASAIQLFVNNLIGLGLGPLLVGLISDLLADRLGIGEAAGLKWAMAGVSIIGVLAFLQFWAARRTIRKDFQI